MPPDFRRYVFSASAEDKRPEVASRIARFVYCFVRTSVLAIPFPTFTSRNPPRDKSFPIETVPSLLRNPPEETWPSTYAFVAPSYARVGSPRFMILFEPAFKFPVMATVPFALKSPVPRPATRESAYVFDAN